MIDQISPSGSPSLPRYPRTNNWQKTSKYRGIISFENKNPGKNGL